MEDKDRRKRRLEAGSPVEIIDTLLNSLDNHFLREIDRAVEAQAWDLVFIGIHSAATTIGCGLFSDSPLTGFSKFLSTFVDTEKEGYNFSAIAKELNDWRHVLVHRWLSELGYTFGFDFEQEEGWREVDDVVLLNPKRYHQAFIDAFKLGGRIWDWQHILSDEEQNAAKERLLKQYDRK